MAQNMNSKEYRKFLQRPEFVESMEELKKACFEEAVTSLRRQKEWKWKMTYLQEYHREWWDHNLVHNPDLIEETVANAVRNFNWMREKISEERLEHDRRIRRDPSRDMSIPLLDDPDADWETNYKRLNMAMMEAEQIARDTWINCGP